MGGFLYYNKKQNPPGEAMVQRCLQALENKRLSDGRSLTRKDTIETDNFAIHLFDKIGASSENLLRFPDSDFIFNTGTLIYKQQIGLNALNALYTDFEADTFVFDKLHGHFCVFIYKGNRLHTFNDFFGVYHVFTSKNNNVISSSFLAVARSLSEKKLNTQAMYEYVFEGASFGNDTYLSGVRLLDAFNIHQLNPPSSAGRKIFNPSQVPTEDWTRNIEETADILNQYFAVLRKCFGHKVCSALSGGYDSRLILALLSENGFDPYIYVYGGDDSEDVRIAKSISAGEKLTIHHDRKKVVKPNIDDFQEIVQTEYFYCDGYGPNGAFTNGAEQLARTDRTRAAVLQLNGGGGEIFRNFWKLPDRPVPVYRFLKSRFDSVPSSYTRSNFNSEAYLKKLHEKIQFMLDTKKSILTRKEIEKLYVYMRVKYWMGHNTGIQNVRTFALIPLIEPVFSFISFDLPHRHKELGLFEAALIKRISPKLAAYNSCYGYNFFDKPSVGHILKNMVAVNTPLSIKRAARRYRYRLSRGPRPFYLQSDYIQSIFRQGDDIMQDYFSIADIRDPLMLSRLQTINLVLADPY